MNLLVTGGAGFIGSNFIKYMLSKYNYTIINLDLLTYAGDIDNLKELINESNYHFVKGDIRNRELLDNLFKKFKIDAVINFAAESHVDRSIENPEEFIQTNVLGTLTLLEIAKQQWKLNSGDKYSIDYRNGVRFIQISTDEVYGSLGKEGYFTEDSNLSPNNPYSASKAAADMLVKTYYETYGLPINITRCSNNFGPYQFPEKLIPMIINKAINNENIPIYGDGKQIRDWLYVEDHCSAIDRVLHKGEIGEVYNIGGNNEKENIEIVRTILNSLGESKNLVVFVRDRLGHDKRYAIDNSKIMKELGWSPSYTFERGMKMTINWYIENKKKTENILIDNYLD